MCLDRCNMHAPHAYDMYAPHMRHACASHVTCMYLTCDMDVPHM